MANKIYTVQETAIVFADSSQTPDENLTLSALAAAASRISARHDRGAAAKTRLFEWRATVQMATAGVIGETHQLYLSTSDGTNPDGEEGTADAAVSSANKLRNMQFFGAIIVDTTSTDTDITASGLVLINSRYVSVVLFNNTADALRTNTGVHSVALTPLVEEIQ